MHNNNTVLLFAKKIILSYCVYFENLETHRTLSELSIANNFFILISPENSKKVFKTIFFSQSVGFLVSQSVARSSNRYAFFHQNLEYRFLCSEYCSFIPNV